MLNEFSYGSWLSACAGLRDTIFGAPIHASVAKSPYLVSDKNFIFNLNADCRNGELGVTQSDTYRLDLISEACANQRFPSNLHC